MKGGETTVELAINFNQLPDFKLVVRDKIGEEIISRTELLEKITESRKARSRKYDQAKKLILRC